MIKMLLILLIIYLAIATGLFIVFLISDVHIKITNFKTESIEEYFYGLGKIKWCLVLSLAWPVVLFQSIFDKEE